ncbi:MAG: Unknown protein [uncultured Thiotrichaceae bacterium]|uniref:DUF4381 domain-containing protein n=1 Tax=uncultured Thiotrichaceae bacterium TaxID=298394 RepID=A0A6S6TC43_9GAMM|nr:MAG: Unknown protein [uncultured Thiotrichaceae bacterium]
MNNPANYFYDIEMPPADFPLYLWLILGVLLLLLVLLVVLRIFQQRQPEIIAMQELQHLSSLSPYQLAALLREGLQETQLKKVLPDHMLKDLDVARYAPSPDIEIKSLVAQAEVFLQDKASRLSSTVLLKRLLKSLKALPLRHKLKPLRTYLVFVINDVKGLLKSLWSRFHG